ncbi:MAG: T9SS type A sorting domain-containing protein [Bacteroidetes bacterium]|nr:T9SS type A sorting domain-containing protein [Bacteroidota bacterium]
MFTKTKTTLLLLLFSVSFLSAQVVETIAEDPALIDGIVLDPTGNIFTTPGAFNGQMYVGMATPTGDFEPDFYFGFEGPADIDRNAAGQFFVTCYDGKSLKRYDPIADELLTLASDLDGPAGVALDAEGNAFVTCYGAPSTFDGNQIIKIHTDGTVEEWLESPQLFRPQGIAFDGEGNLWVANTSSGEIFRIDTTTKELEWMNQLGPQAGSLAFRPNDGLMYFAAQGTNKIYQLDSEGNETLFTGNGMAAVVDGDLGQAQFVSPFGLAFTESGDTLYVSGGGYLRRITQLDFVSSVVDVSGPEVSLYPNPTSDFVRIEWPENILPSNYQWELLDARGGLVASANGDTDQIDLSGLVEGMYLIRVYHRKPFGESQIKKLIKLD